MELKVKEDFDLVNKLLRDPLYKIPDHLRQLVVESAGEILADPGSDSSVRIAASRTVLAMDKTNLDMIKLVMPRRVEQKTDIEIKDQSTEDLLKLVKDAVSLLNANTAPKFVDCEVVEVGPTREPVALIERDRIPEGYSEKTSIG